MSNDMKRPLAEVSLIIVAALVLRTGHVCGYPKRLDYGGDHSSTAKRTQVSTFGGTTLFRNLRSGIQSTTSQNKETTPSVKDIAITDCVKTFCSETKRGNIATRRKGVRIVLGNVARNVRRKERLSSLASVLKVLDNKKAAKDNTDGNGYVGSKDKKNEGSIVGSSFDSNDGHKFHVLSTQLLSSSSTSELPSNSPPMIRPLVFAGKENSKDQATNEKVSSKTVKASTPYLEVPSNGKIDNNSQAFSINLAFSKPDEFLSNVAPTNIRKNANRNRKGIHGFISKGKPQLGDKRQGWGSAKHVGGVPITYDASGPHPLTHGQQPPPVHRYGHGAIHLMVPPGGKGPPVRFIPGQEIPDFNRMVDQGNPGAFMGPGGVDEQKGSNNAPFQMVGPPIEMPFPGTGNYETRQMPMPITKNPGEGQMPVHVSLPPKVHHVPGPMSVVDPSFIGRLVGSPMMNPSTLGPPMVGPSIIGPPMLGPPMVDASTMGPPMLGPPMVDPSTMGPPMLGLPMVGPSTMDPPVIEPSMMENAAVHDDTQPSSVVQQVPVPIPVQSPPRLKHVPFPVPVPVQLPPEIKHVPYPVAVPVRQPPEIHKIFYPIPFREPPRVQSFPFPVFIHPPPEVKKVPVPVGIPSPPQPVPVPVPSPPQVFIHRVPVPVIIPAEDLEAHPTANSFDYDSTPGGQCLVNPCINGGSCTAFLESYRCHCPKGFKGKHCEEISRCHPSPCKNFGSCTEIEDGYECTCAKGFQGRHCEALDPCHPQPCKNGAECWAVGDSFTCSCRVGWMGKNCELESKCLPINPCQNGGTCSEQNGTYKCSCSLGWSGISCEISAPENQSQTTDQCSGCHVNAFCREGHCSCHSGYQGDGYHCSVYKINHVLK